MKLSADSTELQAAGEFRQTQNVTGCCEVDSEFQDQSFGFISETCSRYATRQTRVPACPPLDAATQSTAGRSWHNHVKDCVSGGLLFDTQSFGQGAPHTVHFVTGQNTHPARQGRGKKS